MVHKVCILTPVHPPFDTRIFHKEAKSLVKAGDEVVEGIRIVPLPKAKNSLRE